MTFEEFDRFQEELLKEVVGMKDTKGKEYTNGKDRFNNFNDESKDLDIDRLKIAEVFLNKHIRGIKSFIRDGKIYSDETVRGRIIDAIVYLTLIAGMIEEGKEDYMGYGYTCPNCVNGNHTNCLNPDTCECKVCDTNAAQLQEEIAAGIHQ